MKKYTPLFIIIGAVILMGISIVLSMKSIYTEVNFSEFKESIKNEEFTFIYLGNPNCSHCQAMQDSLKQVKDELGIEILYLNTSKLTSKDITYISGLDASFSEFGTPSFIFIKNGEITGTHVGSKVTGDTFVSLVSEKMNETLYTKINGSKVKEIFNSKTTNVIVFGQSSCGYCSMYKPVLESVVKNYGITINYVEYDLLSQEDKAIISSLDDKLKEFGTPYTIITKKGKIIDEIGEYVEEAELVSKLKTNKIIK